jgi:hypothetical protein
MWKLELRPRYSFSGNICFKFSAFCLCSAPTSYTYQLYTDKPHKYSYQLDPRPATLSLFIYLLPLPATPTGYTLPATLACTHHITYQLHLSATTIFYTDQLLPAKCSIYYYQPHLPATPNSYITQLRLPATCISYIH